MILELRNYCLRMGHCTEYILNQVFLVCRPLAFLLRIGLEYLASHVHNCAFFRYDQIYSETVQNQIKKLPIMFAI